MKSFLDLAKERYSVRSYKDTPVEMEKLAAVLEAGIISPTACNNMPEKIYVVKSPEKREALAKVCKCTFHAPVILVVGYDKKLAASGIRRLNDNYGEADCAIACTHMMLEAQEQGLGSCLVGWFNAREVAKAVNIPEDVEISLMLTLGYEKENSKPSPHHSKYRDVSEMVEIR